MKKIVCLLALLAIFWGSGNGVLAVPIDNHYTVGATVTPVGGNSYKYFYDVANLGQGGGAPHGLDGFFSQVPHSATLSDLTDPVSWSPRGWWEPGFAKSLDPMLHTTATRHSGYQWLYRWGQRKESIYPVGTPAQFSFLVDAPSGTNQGFAETYLGWLSSQGYEGNMTGPVPVLGTLLLLGSALVGVAALGRRRRSK